MLSCMVKTYALYTACVQTKVRLSKENQVKEFELVWSAAACLEKATCKPIVPCVLPKLRRYSIRCGTCAPYRR